jgi:hypothetical protein
VRSVGYEQEQEHIRSASRLVVVVGVHVLVKRVLLGRPEDWIVLASLGICQFKFTFSMISSEHTLKESLDGLHAHYHMICRGSLVYDPAQRCRKLRRLRERLRMRGSMWETGR